MEDFQYRSLWTNDSMRQFICPWVGQCKYQYQICFCICVCAFLGHHLLPIHSYELDISIIMWYQNSVLSIFTHIQIFTYISGKVVVTTALCIFSVVITTSPHWRLMVYYVYFWSGDHIHRLLDLDKIHCQDISVLFIFRRHHDQSTTVDWVYFRSGDNIFWSQRCMRVMEFTLLI